MAVQKEISKSVLKRLPIYLSYLRAMPETAPDHISATALAQALGMGEVQVRKDLALVSSEVCRTDCPAIGHTAHQRGINIFVALFFGPYITCLLYTSRCV